MGWSSAGSIIDPQIPIMDKLVQNDELPEAAAVVMLVSLIKQLQEGDWDTEYETLERYLHVPWAVRAFKQCGVEYTGGEGRTRDDVKMVVRSCIDANVESWYDLSEDFARNVHANAIADALAEFLNLEK